MACLSDVALAKLEATGSISHIVAGFSKTLNVADGHHVQLLHMVPISLAEVDKPNLCKCYKVL